MAKTITTVAYLHMFESLHTELEFGMTVFEVHYI